MRGLVITALLGLCAIGGCADDPSPKPAPDEPLFLRKTFILPSAEGAQDKVWRLSAFTS